MLGHHKPKDQTELFRSRLDSIISPNHELVRLSGEMDWQWIEEQLSEYYSQEGRPSVPVRTMVSLLLLKQIYNQSDESVLERWVENPYWQYFSGKTYFQHKPPFDPTDFVYFRRRIGEAGMEKVLSMTVRLHPGAAEEKIVQIDTTVQEKNITFPTDTKLQMRIINYVWHIAKLENIDLRQSYKFVLKDLRLQMHNGSHPRRKKQAEKARKKVKTICSRLLRDIERKLDADQRQWYAPWLEMYGRVLDQRKNSKNKIYSLHEPHVKCISKGKAHKKYEFGNKVAIVRTAVSGVITGMKSFVENVYDGHALEPSLEHCQQICELAGGKRPEVAVVDRGCKGRKTIGETQIFIPGKPLKNQSEYEKRKLRKLFRARAAIEPVIGHLKYDHRMLRNYLSGILGDAVNALMAGAAFNVKKRLNQIKKELKTIFWPFWKSVTQTCLKLIWSLTSPV